MRITDYEVVDTPAGLMDHHSNQLDELVRKVDDLAALVKAVILWLGTVVIIGDPIQ